MEHRGGVLHDRLHGGEIGDVARHRPDPRIVEARPARLADVEQQEFADPRGLAVGSGDRSLLQDAPRQLLAEKARAAGDHHLHVVSIPFVSGPILSLGRVFFAAEESVHRSSFAVYVSSNGGNERNLRLQGRPDRSGYGSRRGAGGAPPEGKSDPGLPRRRRGARPARPRPSRRVFARHRLAHRHRREADRLHRRSRHRLPAVLHRPGTVDAPPAHHAPAGVRAGRAAGLSDRAPDRSGSAMARPAARRLADHRHLPGAVLDRHRHGAAVGPAPHDVDDRPHQLRHPARPGSRRGAPPAPDQRVGRT